MIDKLMDSIEKALDLFPEVSDNLYKKNGYQHQTLIFIGELYELGDQIAKSIRHGKVFRGIYSELADVTIGIIHVLYQNRGQSFKDHVMPVINNSVNVGYINDTFDDILLLNLLSYTRAVNNLVSILSITTLDRDKITESVSDLIVCIFSILRKIKDNSHEEFLVELDYKLNRLFMYNEIDKTI